MKKVLAFLAFLLTVFIVLAYIVNLQDDKPNGISNENQQADTTGQVEAPTSNSAARARCSARGNPAFKISASVILSAMSIFSWRPGTKPQIT